MEQSELNIILKEHTKWLEDTSTGKRANLRYANLGGLDLRNANLSSADLRYANLRDLDLRDVDLTHASLTGANIRYAIGNGREIKTLQTEFYTVVYTSTEMAIGCEHHNITDWFEFDYEHIEAMDERATEFWAIYKPVLITLININNILIN